MAIQSRIAMEDRIYAVLKKYREVVALRFAKDSPIYLSMPRLTPLPGHTPAAVVCEASTPDAWTWTGRLDELASVEAPRGAAGVLIIGDVVEVRASLAAAVAARQEPTRGEVKYGRYR
jgi:precorrin-4 methylase